MARQGVDALSLARAAEGRPRTSQQPTSIHTASTGPSNTIHLLSGVLVFAYCRIRSATMPSHHSWVFLSNSPARAARRARQEQPITKLQACTSKGKTQHARPGTCQGRAAGHLQRPTHRTAGPR